MTMVDMYIVQMELNPEVLVLLRNSKKDSRKGADLVYIRWRRFLERVYISFAILQVGRLSEKLLMGLGEFSICILNT